MQGWASVLGHFLLVVLSTRDPDLSYCGITLLNSGMRASRRYGKSLGPISPVWPLTVSAQDRMFRALERPWDC